MSSAIRTKKWRLKQKEELGEKNFRKLETQRRQIRRRKRKLESLNRYESQDKERGEDDLGAIKDSELGSLQDDIYSEKSDLSPGDITENYHIFKSPSTCIVAGPTMSGKSTLMCKILDYKDKIISPPVEEIIWCYGIESPQLLELKNKYPGIKLHRGLPDLEKLSQLPRGVRRMLVIDDLMSETKGGILTNLFTKYSHHMDCSVFYLCQNILNNAREMRNIYLNAMYKILFYNPGDLTQISLLNNRMYPGHPQFLCKVLKEVSKQPHGFILLDQHPKTPNDLRVKSHIFPGQENYIYLPS